MGKNKEYELAIKIAGEVEKSFYESMRLSKKELQDIARQAAGTSMKIRETLSKGIKDSEPFFSGLESAAKTAFGGITKAAALAGAGITAGLGASVHVGSEFESAFAGVKKTVDASNVELKEMRDAIREMARDDLPATAAELSAIAESAGQLGIRNENIIGFTRTMEDLDVSTDLGDDAASDFAKFANITGMDQGYFSNLGSTVVALGNNMATQESNIVDMGMRIAAAGNQIGLSAADIMGYSAALSSVGLEADAGGTAFSKLLANLQMAAETGDKLEEYASVAGMAGQEFRQAFQDDATKAVNAFLAGLTDTEQNGKSAIAVLDEMGLTEVRLRDTLLRAGNASELFADALGISNDAWKENTALANEAEQRYKTFESQCQMTENKLTDIGITVYDGLRPALTEGIGLANEFIDEFAVRISSSMPTVIRQTREAALALGDLAQPFLEVGGWLADNPGLVVGTIAGIGTSLAAYKVVSGVMSLAKALGALTPAGKVVMALGCVTGVIIGISTAVKKAAEDAKQANLAAHFGDISLSVAELQETAAAVLQSQNLDKLHESISAMGEADGIADDIMMAAKELDRMNWKVSVGIELTEDEQEEYRRQIDTYIQSMQDYAIQHQYEVSLSVSALLGEDLESSNVVGQLNAFYAGRQQELAALGKELNETVTEAFQDGLLDIDETKKIAELQQQMADIKAAMAGSNFESGLGLLGMKYGNQSLDADSFINLQAEIQEQTNQAMADYDEAYVRDMSAYREMLSAGKENGGWSQAEYDAAVAELNEGYLLQKSGLQAKGVQFQIDVIRQAYGEEWGGLTGKLRDEAGRQLGEMLEHVAEGGPNVHLDLLPEDILGTIEIDQPVKDAMADLYEQMKPGMEQMQEIARQYEEAGKEIPDSVRQGLSDMGAIGALAGDVDAIWVVLGEAAGSQEYQEVIKKIEEDGGYIPEAIAHGISGNQQVIDEAVMQSARKTQEAYNKYFGKGIGVSASGGIIQNGIDIANSAFPEHKDGGIFDKPHLGWIAEAGYPEAAIPIDGSQNAIGLWLKTGELLGMDGLTGGPSPLSADIEEAAYAGTGETVLQIDNSRVINFNGNAPSREEIDEILEDEDEKFARQMERYLGSIRRTRFYDNGIRG